MRFSLVICTLLGIFSLINAACLPIICKNSEKRPTVVIVNNYYYNGVFKMSTPIRSSAGLLERLNPCENSEELRVPETQIRELTKVASVDPNSANEQWTGEQSEYPSRGIPNHSKNSHFILTKPETTLAEGSSRVSGGTLSGNPHDGTSLAAEIPIGSEREKEAVNEILKLVVGLPFDFGNEKTDEGTSPARETPQANEGSNNYVVTQNQTPIRNGDLAGEAPVNFVNEPAIVSEETIPSDSKSEDETVKNVVITEGDEPIVGENLNIPDGGENSIPVGGRNLGEGIPLDIENLREIVNDIQNIPGETPFDHKNEQKITNDTPQVEGSSNISKEILNGIPNEGNGFILETPIGSTNEEGLVNELENSPLGFDNESGTVGKANNVAGETPLIEEISNTGGVGGVLNETPNIGVNPVVVIPVDYNEEQGKVEQSVEPEGEVQLGESSNGLEGVQNQTPNIGENLEAGTPAEGYYPLVEALPQSENEQVPITGSGSLQGDIPSGFKNEPGIVSETNNIVGETPLNLEFPNIPVEVPNDPNGELQPVAETSSDYSNGHETVNGSESPANELSPDSKNQQITSIETENLGPGTSQIKESGNAVTDELNGTPIEQGNSALELPVNSIAEQETNENRGRLCGSSKPSFGDNLIEATRPAAENIKHRQSGWPWGWGRRRYGGRNINNDWNQRRSRWDWGRRKHDWRNKERELNGRRRGWSNDEKWPGMGSIGQSIGSANNKETEKGENVHPGGESADSINNKYQSLNPNENQRQNQSFTIPVVGDATAGVTGAAAGSMEYRRNRWLGRWERIKNSWRNNKRGWYGRRHGWDNGEERGDEEYNPVGAPSTTSENQQEVGNKEEIPAEGVLSSPGNKETKNNNLRTADKNRKTKQPVKGNSNEKIKDRKNGRRRGCRKHDRQSAINIEQERNRKDNSHEEIPSISEIVPDNTESKTEKIPLIKDTSNNLEEVQSPQREDDLPIETPVYSGNEQESDKQSGSLVEEEKPQAEEVPNVSEEIQNNTPSAETNSREETPVEFQNEPAKENEQETLQKDIPTDSDHGLDTARKTENIAGEIPLVEGENPAIEISDEYKNEPGTIEQTKEPGGEVQQPEESSTDSEGVQNQTPYEGGNSVGETPVDPENEQSNGSGSQGSPEEIQSEPKTEDGVPNNNEVIGVNTPLVGDNLNIPEKILNETPNKDDLTGGTTKIEETPNISEGLSNETPNEVANSAEDTPVPSENEQGFVNENRNSNGGPFDSENEANIAGKIPIDDVTSGNTDGTTNRIPKDDNLSNEHGVPSDSKNEQITIIENEDHIQSRPLTEENLDGVKGESSENSGEQEGSAGNSSPMDKPKTEGIRDIPTREASTGCNKNKNKASVEIKGSGEEGNIKHQPNGWAWGWGHEHDSKNKIISEPGVVRGSGNSQEETPSDSGNEQGNIQEIKNVAGGISALPTDNGGVNEIKSEQTEESWNNSSEISNGTPNEGKNSGEQTSEHLANKQESVNKGENPLDKPSVVSETVQEKVDEPESPAAGASVDEGNSIITGGILTGTSGEIPADSAIIKGTVPQEGKPPTEILPTVENPHISEGLDNQSQNTGNAGEGQGNSVNQEENVKGTDDTTGETVSVGESANVPGEILNDTPNEEEKPVGNPTIDFVNEKEIVNKNGNVAEEKPSDSINKEGIPGQTNGEEAETPPAKESFTPSAEGNSVVNTPVNSGDEQENANENEIVQGVLPSNPITETETPSKTDKKEDETPLAEQSSPISDGESNRTPSADGSSANQTPVDIGNEKGSQVKNENVSGDVPPLIATSQVGQDQTGPLNEVGTPAGEIGVESENKQQIVIDNGSLQGETTSDSIIEPETVSKPESVAVEMPQVAESSNAPGENLSGITNVGGNSVEKLPADSGNAQETINDNPIQILPIIKNEEETNKEADSSTDGSSVSSGNKQESANKVNNPVGKLPANTKDDKQEVTKGRGSSAGRQSSDPRKKKNKTKKNKNNVQTYKDDSSVEKESVEVSDSDSGHKKKKKKKGRGWGWGRKQKDSGSEEHEWNSKSPGWGSRGRGYGRGGRFGGGR